MTRIVRPAGAAALLVLLGLLGCFALTARAEDSLEQGFRNPPPECRPEVFWDWMGGLISQQGITKDLEALARQGVGGVLIMQLPDQLAGTYQWRFRDYPGKVRCLSDQWFSLMNHAAGEADRLGLTISLFMCPGWSHCGGPWIKPEKSLKMLVASRTEVVGPRRFDEAIPRAEIHKPRSDRTVPWNPESEAWQRILNPREDFYRDVAVVAIPTVDEQQAVPLPRIVDLTGRMDARGRLLWDVPEGKWTVIRLGVASENGPNHPAPLDGMGLECDRMDPQAVRLVFDGMVGRIVREARAKGYRSVRRFETDSYEGGRQDFGVDFREEFRQRRGYDCTPWLPAWLDRKIVIQSADLSERFRRDMLQTISDLWIERFYGQLRRLADQNGLEWMIEPYFLMNHDWRTAGSRAHLPGSEFWMGGQQLIGPAPDIAALYGHRVVWAEAFTAESYQSAWRNDPWKMKPFGDAAFCRGINHFIMHGFVHNPWNDSVRPGLSMGFWGTQLNRNLTWWPYSAGWHRYLARSQFLLRQGLQVADVLTYPPKAEHIPGPVLDTGAYQQTVLNDEALIERLAVRDGRLVLPHGTSYAAMALVPGQPLRPEPLKRIRDLVMAGATLIGPRPPARSASLENYPDSDRQVARLIDELWGEADRPGQHGGTTQSAVAEGRRLGSGRVMDEGTAVAALERILGGPDFRWRRLEERNHGQSVDARPNVLFCHRRADASHIYFLANQQDEVLQVEGDFRLFGKQPELWDPVAGIRRLLSDSRQVGGRTLVALRLEPRQSFFVVFREKGSGVGACGELSRAVQGSGRNFPASDPVAEIMGPWEVSFDPKWGGPERVTFEQLADWTQRPEPGIKYYSGTAVYRKTFDLPRGATQGKALWLDLGTVKNLARVRLNDQDLGVAWCAPWRVRISGALKPRGNRLEVAVVNTWVNRLIGDEREPDDCELVAWDPPARKGGYVIDVPSRALKDLPDWLIRGEPRPSTRRYTFSSWRFYPKDAPLLESGLLGPVTLQETAETETGGS